MNRDEEVSIPARWRVSMCTSKEAEKCRDFVKVGINRSARDKQQNNRDKTRKVK